MPIDLNRPVLITGASGFLGHYLIRTAPEALMLIAQVNTTPVIVPKKRFLSWRMDLEGLKPEQLIALEPGVIIHAAACTSLEACEADPKLAYRVNVEATERIARAAATLGAHFILISTDIVFDGRKGNYRESDAPNPINVYGRTKWQAEQAVRSHLSDALILRVALLYGKSLGGRVSFTEHMLERLQQGKTVHLFADEYRTPVLVDQVADLIWQCVEERRSGLYHIAGPERLSRLEMGHQLAELFNLPVQAIQPTSLSQAALKARRPADVSMNITRAIRELDFHPCTFSEGLLYSFPVR